MHDSPSPPSDAAARRPRRRRVAGAACIAAIALAAAAAAYLHHREAAARPTYLTAIVDRGTVAPGVTSSGSVNPVTTVQVGTYVSGVIESLSCDFNTRVRAGQRCARIDARPYETVVEQESANLRAAHAQLAKDRGAQAYAQIILERDARLLGRGAVSQETVDTARNDRDQASAQVALDTATIAQHEAALKSARINLGYTEIVSPVDGTVVSRNVTQGQTVAASFQTPTLFLIATDLTKMEVDTNVSESDIGRVADGDEVTFTVEAFPERRFAGVVQQVRQAPQSVQNVVTYDVVVGVANADLALKPGMTASVRIVTRRVDGVLRVPSQALRYAPRAGTGAGARKGAAHHAAVWVLREGRPQRVEVAAGLDDDANVQIVEGALREGDVVVVGERSGSSDGTDAAPPPRLGRP